MTTTPATGTGDETPLSQAEVTQRAYAARDEYAAGRTPRVMLSDIQVNALARDARPGGHEPSRELLTYWANKLIARYGQKVDWTRYSDVGPEDMWQEARAVFLKAIDKFNPTSGYNFGAYAAQVITNHLGEWFEAHSLAVRVPRYTRRRLRHEGEIDDTTRRAKSAELLPRYLFAIFDGDDEGGNLLDKQQVPHRGDIDLPESVEDGLLRRDLFARLRAAYFALHELERSVLQHRFVQEMSIERTARALHMGMGGVRELERQALARLHDALKGYLNENPASDDVLAPQEQRDSEEETGILAAR